MADQQDPKKESAETRPIPSQAEGEDPATSGEGERSVPSQAEGDEATIDESLRQKEGKQ
ncbi:MAG: hypothetical protein H7039_16115 [Bryobacteraceae bacterium]|nr:hypothetical protein [Bryobacteraceae bacterium]